MEDKITPKIRFKGFTDSWEQRKLGDMCFLITKQTGFDYSETIKPSLVTERNSDVYSFIQNKDFDGERINLDTDFYICSMKKHNQVRFQDLFAYYLHPSVS